MVPLLISIAVSLAPLGYTLYCSNKLNYLNSHVQESRVVAPRPGTFLQVNNWLLDAAVDLLRRHLHWNYVSPLMMAFLFMTLPLVESSFSFLVP